MARHVNTATTDTSKGSRRSPVQSAGAVVGIVFLFVGILGFIPGITTNFDDIGFVGHQSDAKVLGLFQVNILHNVVHLLFGVFGLVLARTPSWARNYLLLGGVVYLVLWLYGLVIDFDTAWNFVALNSADNWLHAGLGIAMLALGVAVPTEKPAAVNR